MSLYLREENVSRVTALRVGDKFLQLDTPKIELALIQPRFESDDNIYLTQEQVRELIAHLQATLEMLP